MLTLTIPKPIPLPSEAVLRSLRLCLEEKRWQPGDRLPPEESLAKEMRIARGTLRRALKRLEAEGLLVAARGRGRVVAAGRDGGKLMAHVIAIISNIGKGVVVRRNQEEIEKAVEVGVEEALDQESLHRLTLHPSGLEGEGLQRFLSDPPLGAIVNGLVSRTEEGQKLLATLASHGIPLVVNSDGPALAGYDRVISDHQAGCYELTRWLIGQGRRRILRAWGVAKGTYFLEMRNTGYERAMREAKLESLPPLYIPANGVEISRELARETFELRSRTFAGYLLPYLTGLEPIDAIMVSTDSHVYPAATACRICGRTPHREVTIVGYDGYWSGWPDRELEPTVPAATVVKHNRQTGVEMVRILLERVNGTAPTPLQRVALAPELVVVTQAMAG